MEIHIEREVQDTGKVRFVVRQGGVRLGSSPSMAGAQEIVNTHAMISDQAARLRASDS